MPEVLAKECRKLIIRRFMRPNDQKVAQEGTPLILIPLVTPDFRDENIP
jgi:hypothetical protein